ncbi:MAG: calcium/sodium antiporter [bacterium]
MIISGMFLFISLVLIVFSANILVSGASSMARKNGISPFVIGLTILAFGTSAPELTVNIFSSLNNESSIAFGNIVGSNIFNILVILGLASIIHPLSTGKGTVWKEIPIALASALAVLILPLLSRQNTILRFYGIILILFFIVYILFTLKNIKITSRVSDISLMSNTRSLIYMIAGLTGLFLGGRYVVLNSVRIAELLNIDGRIISITIIAAGTSLPEMATSVMAAIKGEDDIAVGNIVGSNIFNILLILGISSTIKPIHISTTMFIDVSVMIIASLILFLAMFTGKKRVIDRFEGIIMLCLYAIYIAYVIIMR